MDKKNICNSIILQMFYGHIGPDDIDGNEESAKIYEKYEKYENEFVSRLQTPELKEMYHKLNDAFFAMDCEGNNNFLIGGFRLGFLMALEVVGFKPPKNFE